MFLGQDIIHLSTHPSHIAVSFQIASSLWGDQTLLSQHSNNIQEQRLNHRRPHSATKRDQGGPVR